MNKLDKWELVSMMLATANKLFYVCCHESSSKKSLELPSYLIEFYCFYDLIINMCAWSIDVSTVG